MQWCVYILKCSDETFYTGITNDLNKRIEKHNSGKGAKYTRGRSPVKLMISFDMKSKSEAAKEEYRIKKLNKQQKQQLIMSKKTLCQEVKENQRPAILDKWEASHKIEVELVKTLGDKIGYGNMMSIASALWANKLEDSGVPKTGAFIPTIPSDMKKKWADKAIEEQTRRAGVFRKMFAKK